MHRRFPLWLFGFSLFFSVSWAITDSTAAEDKAVPEQKAERTDELGDPLPPGVLLRLGTLRMRHQGVVLGVALSPDGKLVASLNGSAEQSIRLWDATTGKQIHQFAVPDGYGFWHGKDVVFSPDGTAVVAAIIGQGGEPLRLWDVKTGKVLAPNSLLDLNYQE